MIATDIEINYTYEGKCKLILTLQKKPNMDDLQDLKAHANNNKLLDISIKKHRKKRSLDANAYMWVLLQKIAEKISSTKEEIYLNIIRQVGQFEMVPVADDKVEYWINAWNSRGLGWHSERLRGSKFDGYTTTINYYGSSVYNTEEMSIVINSVVDEAKELGIETITPDEINLLLKKMEGEKVVSKEKEQT